MACPSKPQSHRLDSEPPMHSRYIHTSWSTASSANESERTKGRRKGPRRRTFLLIYIIHHAFIHSCSIITSKEGTSILSYPVICIYLLGHRDRGDVRITQIRRIEVHCCIGHVRMHDHKSRSLSIRITAFTPSHDRSGDVRSLYRKPYSCRRRRQ